MTHPFDPLPAARALARAWQGGPRVPAAALAVADDAQAYQVQDALARLLGPTGGWKVGSPDDHSEPNAAPLPASALLASGGVLRCPARSLRVIELEVAVRLRADLMPGDRLPGREEVLAAIGAVLPVIEVVDTRLAEGREAPAAARLADLQSHGALVLGEPSGIDPRVIDMKSLRTRLWFDAQPAVDVTGGHAAPDLWRLLAWLARAAQARGMPLRAGQVITTGSCTPLAFAPEGARVTGEAQGLGRVELQLQAG